MFAYACPSCKQRLLAPRERVGQRTICPKCLRPLVIPHPETDDFTVDLGQSVAESPVTETPPVVATPSPYQPRPLSSASGPVARRSLSRSESGMVNLNPTGLAAVDIGAELSAALTMRMKPPPDPPTDLNLSTGGWLALTGLAAAAWVGGVVADPALLPFVALTGALMVAFGFLWAAMLAGQRNWLRGVITLLPPVALWRICLPFGDNGYRPLRFVLTGLIAVGAYFLGFPAQEGLQKAIAVVQQPPPGTVDRVTTAAERLALATGRPDNGLSAIGDLANSDYRSAIPLDEHPAVVAELGRIVTDPARRPEIRMQALQTLAKWSLADARMPTLEMLRSANAPERRVALALAPAWPDEEMATAVAEKLAVRSEERLAREALAKMAPASNAVLLDLARAPDPVQAMIALELLEVTGTKSLADPLKQLARQATDSVIRAEAARLVGVVADRP